MILSDTTCSCGSTVEIATTLHPDRRKLGWKVYCTGTALSPIRRTQLGAAWLPPLNAAEPDQKPKADWLRGVKHAVQKAIEQRGGHGSRFEIVLDPAALELFRHAAL